MGPNSGGPTHEEWHMSRENRQCFLKPVKFSREAINRFRNNEASVRDQCLFQLEKICESLQHNNVLITDRIAFSQKIWDLHAYEADPSAFPISNVQIKCNILSAMLDLLRSHPGDNLADNALDNVTKVLNYLRKLLDAAVFKDNTKPARPTEVSALDQSRLRRPSLVANSSSYRKKINGSRSSTASSTRSKELGLDNISKFHEYKPLIISLYHKLTFLDQSSQTSDIIFDFVFHHVCKFIIADCKLLLADYIGRQILPI